MQVRAATKDDVNTLSEFVTEWVVYQLLCAGFIFDPEIFKQHLQASIDAQNVLVIEADNKIVGGIGGRIVQSFYTKDIIFDVMTMYIDPDYRKFTGHVLAALEKILSLTTATKIVLANPNFQNSELLDDYYKMKGYRSLQTSFIKDIKREATTL